MAWTHYQLLLSVVMVITGSINTLGVKWADDIRSIGKEGETKRFTHPLFQTCCMFFGELCCLITFKILYKIYNLKLNGSEDVRALTKGNRNFNPLILLIPALCDIVGASLTYVGLNLTYPATFQRPKGSTLIFVCLFSIGFLRTIPKGEEWCGILFIIIGLSLVGFTEFFPKEDSKESYRKNIISGYTLVFLAQIITSFHMVFEEKYVTSQDIPSLQAVGWEGLFGFCITSFLLLPFYFIRGGPPITEKAGDRLDDAIEAFIQISHNWYLTVAIVGTIVSIAFYNFAGISVTKELSATTRMVVDSTRTIIVWMFSLGFFGQRFHWLQPIGFILLLIGMCLYNEILVVSVFNRLRCCRKEQNISENRGDRQWRSVTVHT